MTDGDPGLVSHDSVAAVAQVLGYRNLSGEGITSLAPQLEGVLRRVIQEGVSIMRHSRRARLTTTDIKSALRVLGQPPVMGVPPVPPPYVQPSSGVFVTPSAPVDIAAILASDVPPAPVAPSFTTHWLAIEGVQPSIPENPGGVMLAPQDPLKRRRLGPSGGGAGAGAGAGGGGDGSAAAGGGGGGGGGVVGTSSVVKPPLAHALTKELQTYFTKVINAVSSGNARDRKAVLGCVRTDGGLQPLVPYFSQFFLSEVRKELARLSYVDSMLQLFGALLYNKSLKLELYLQQFLPWLLTCVVTRYLGSRTSDHWRLRRTAAQYLAVLASRYGTMIPDLPIRILGAYKSVVHTRTLPGPPLTTQFGAICGIAALGQAAFMSTLLSEVSRLQARFTAEFQEAQQLALSAAAPKRAEARVQLREASMCEDALLGAVGKAVYRAETRPTASLDEQLFEVFGEKLMPWISRLPASAAGATFL